MTRKERIILTYRPSRLATEHIQKPEEAFEDYFSCFTLQDCRRHLWELYERCVMSYHREHTYHEDASDILLFYKYTEMIVEAAWLINNKKQKLQQETLVASEQRSQWHFYF
jgi:transcription initiation factor IIE alpha subunit